MIPFLKPILPSVERYQYCIHQMHQDNWFSNNGHFVQTFGARLQQYLKTDREIVLVNNATTGLMIALEALQIQGTVLVPSFTFAATIGAIDWCGLDYEYVDTDWTWSMCPEKTEEKLKTGSYGAIMPVHTFGSPCDIRSFERLAKKYGVKLIFDAAPALGASYCGQPIGNFGDAEVFSLHATKTLPVGEGGLISFRNSKDAARARQIMNFGFQDDRTAHTRGLNGKMPEILAAIGIEALKDLDQHIRNRQAYVELYEKYLDHHVEYQETQKNCTHSHQCFGVLIEDNSKIEQKMLDQGIQVRRYFCDPMHTHPAHKRQVILPNTEKIAKRIVNLPLYSIMDEHTIQYVSNELKEVLWKA